ncbi:MAG: hypothetical protein AAF296_12530 [Pseudomonadota bacterium]
MKQIVCTILCSLAVGLPTAAQESDGQLQLSTELSPETRAHMSTRIDVPQYEGAMALYLRGEGGDGIMLDLARSGHRDAARVIGRECLRGRMCATTRQESHDLLVASAQTDPGSAQELAAIYRDGLWGGKAFPVDAAKWLVHAHKLGSTSAVYMLEGLPIDAVREAGAEYLLPEPIAPEQQTVSPAPQQEAADMTEGDNGLYTMSESEMTALADLLFGTGGGNVPLGGPTVLPWSETESGFPVFVDSALNNVGDAAASCYLVASEDLERVLARIQAGTNTSSERVEMETDAMMMEFYFETLGNSELNGGAGKVIISIALDDHKVSKSKHPYAGPSKDFCKDNFVSFMTDDAIARAEAAQ